MINSIKNKAKFIISGFVLMLIAFTSSIAFAKEDDSVLGVSGATGKERGIIVNKGLLSASTDNYNFAYEARRDAVSIQEQTTSAVVEALKAKNEREDLQAVTAANLMLARSIMMFNKMTAKNFELTAANKAAYIEE
jgi:hypothetical protein